MLQIVSRSHWYHCARIFIFEYFYLPDSVFCIIIYLKNRYHSEIIFRNTLNWRPFPLALKHLFYRTAVSCLMYEEKKRKLIFNRWINIHSVFLLLTLIYYREFYLVRITIPRHVWFWRVTRTYKDDSRIFSFSYILLFMNLMWVVMSRNWSSKRKTYKNANFMADTEKRLTIGEMINPVALVLRYVQRTGVTDGILATCAWLTRRKITFITSPLAHELPTTLARGVIPAWSEELWTMFHAAKLNPTSLTWLMRVHSTLEKRPCRSCAIWELGDTPYYRPI